MVTSIENMRALGTIREVELPDWSGEGTIKVRLGRPSMLTMIRTGRIPNALLSVAQSVFSGAGTGEADFSEVAQLLRSVVDATLVEPTLSELEAAGLELTDEQQMLIFNYSQQGVAALSGFRIKQQDAEPDSHGKDVRTAAKRGA
jgi:hypothetical protein